MTGTGGTMRSPMWLLCRLLTITVAFILVTTLSGFGQDCRITTTVRLLSENEHPALNVTADQLTAVIGGAPAKVVAFSPGVKPCNDFGDRHQQQHERDVGSIRGGSQTTIRQCWRPCRRSCISRTNHRSLRWPR